ncbi:MAG: adenine deaminase [Eubacteriales bacterium]|nr:adenine deaminase [Eubacteriales bacterium]
MESEELLKKQILAASGAEPAELVFKNARIVNVFTEELEEADVAVTAGYIVGIGNYHGKTEVELGEGKILCPAFLDGHIHLESSMVSPWEFQKTVLPHGTSCVITDPHEIANVAGTAGIRYMMEATKNLDLEVYFMLPSCVPSTPLDESGAVLGAEELRSFYESERVLGLAELMNFYGTVAAEDGILKKLLDAKANNRLIDGHAPFLSGKALNAYVTAGVTSDHECSGIEEAKEKLRRGQWIMIREGTAAQNLNALMPLFAHPYCLRSLLVTDDKHPEDLMELGHIDYIIKKAIKNGADPITAIRMGSYNVAACFGLKHKGAIAPGYEANLVVIDNFDSFRVEQVYQKGRLVAEQGKCLTRKRPEEKWDEEIRRRVFDSFHMKEIREEDLFLKARGEKQRVIGLQPRELLTRELIVPWQEKEGYAPGVDIDRDIIKLAVFERHHASGHVGIGYVSGYGLKKGAVASSVAHDSHNLIVAGTNDRDMMIAGNRVRENKGGLAVVVDGEVIGDLPLPIAGLMTDACVSQVEKKLQEMKAALSRLGIPDTVDAFMTLAFTSLPVIPKLRLNTYGLIDVDAQRVAAVRFDE